MKPFEGTENNGLIPLWEAFTHPFDSLIFLSMREAWDDIDFSKLTAGGLLSGFL